jgi:hypothetical protein
MKHLLNNMPEWEKNSIREQHKSEINLEISRFKKLLESKVGDVKPLIVEAQMTKEMLQTKTNSCFDAKKYPVIKNLMQSAGLSILAIAAFAVTYLSGGITGGLTLTAGIFASADAITKLTEAIKSDSSLKSEIEQFAKCLMS